MYHYDFSEWLLFFYVYCLFGWCFESTYVSLKSRKFVNRGFLKGPFLPIYGSGAIAVLFTTLPFQKNAVLVYIVGMLSATALEYVTGVTMEAMFKVRYWDYSNQKIQFQGHICLSSSIAWGGLSLALVYGFHKPVERFILSFPETFLQVFVFVVTIVLAADCAISFKTAFELRDVLIKLEEAKQELKRMQKRLEVIEAIIADEGAQKREQFKDELELLRERQIAYRERLKGHLQTDKLNMLRRNPTAISHKYRETFEEYRNRLKDLDIVEDIKEGIDDFLNRL